MRAVTTKRVTFEIMALLIEKKLPKPSRKLRRKPCVLIREKPPKLNEIIRRKTGDLFNKKPPNSMRKQREKPGVYLMKNLLT